jgi:hypothetical protein
MNVLRQELMDAQRTRFQLIQWKLMIVSALGATGLGLTGAPNLPNARLVLCCIPFACIYADALIYHQGMISHVIGEFLRAQNCGSGDAELKALAAYEEFSLKARVMNRGNSQFSAYGLEKITLHWASALFSIAVAFSAAIQPFDNWPALAITGILGLIFSLLLRRSYETRRLLLRPTA